MLILLASLLACVPTAGPCEEYCSYICDCHAGDDSVISCQQCRNEYPDADPALQDACETALTEQVSADETSQYVCNDGSAGDTAAAR